jgi:hypothetical protein
MDTAILKLRRAAGEAAKRRRLRDNELKELFTGVVLVFSGLLLAALYGLITHHIAA